MIQFKNNLMVLKCVFIEIFFGFLFSVSNSGLTSKVAFIRSEQTRPWVLYMWVPFVNHSGLGMIKNNFVNHSGMGMIKKPFVNCSGLGMLKTSFVNRSGLGMLKTLFVNHSGLVMLKTPYVNCSGLGRMKIFLLKTLWLEVDN